MNLQGILFGRFTAVFDDFCPMFKKLRQHWGVGPIDLFLILTTFALTGTTTAWITRVITSWVPASPWSPSWITLKLIILVFGYQILILIFGFLLGQFSFFWNYEKKILTRLGLLAGRRKKMVRLAVFASGTGTNFQRLIEEFRTDKKTSISLLVCDKPAAGALKIAEKNGIPVRITNPAELTEGLTLGEFLKENRIDYLILAGFLKKIPPHIIDLFPRRIINIHPALLPKYGGKGMYGAKVHEAVIRSGDRESGITIHFVDEHYDAGDIIFRKKCVVDEKETADSLAKKIHALEHENYGEQIKKLIESQNT